MRADKSFGQHFLVNQGLIEKIAESVARRCEVHNTRALIEIGPGPGALTGALLKRGLKVFAFELDKRMVTHLESFFSDYVEKGLLKLVEADALSCDFSGALKESPVVCGNLPYNVGTAILFRFLEQFPGAKSFCFMLQKEVVLRLISTEGKSYGAAGVKFQWLCKELDHYWIKPGSFNPPPKVDSGIVLFERIPNTELKISLEKDARRYMACSRFVDKLFQKRRKMLRAILPALATTPVGTLRPEQLSADKLLDLALEYGEL